MDENDEKRSHLQRRKHNDNNDKHPLLATIKIERERSQQFALVLHW